MQLKEYQEMHTDGLYFTFISEVKHECTNETAKEFLTLFLVDYIASYNYEFINANKVNITKEQMDKIRNLRNRTLKKQTANSNEIQRIIQAMGINYKNWVFDMVVVNINEKVLYTNFDYFQLKNEYGSDFLGRTLNTPKVINNLVFEKINLNIYERMKDYVVRTAKNVDNFFANVQRDSYSSGEMCKYIDNIEDKNMLLYRYRMIKSFEIIETLFNIDLTIEIGTFKTSMEVFIMKLKAILIEILYRDFKNRNSSIVSSIAERIKREIEPGFFKLNRKLRNNIHYNRNDSLSIDELLFISNNQALYMAIINEEMNSRLHFKKGLLYKVYNYFAKKSLIV